MSSPDVNINKQRRRHKGPLIGFLVCSVFVGALLVAYLTRVVEPAAPAPEAEATTDVSQ